MSAKLSIIIPVYNTEALLSRCLESVTTQTLHDVEIICVDDGSTDSSGALLDKWAERDERIKVIHQSNGRQGKARNAAMRIATGDYIGMFDSDDYLLSDYFEKLYTAAIRHDADIAVCGIIKQKRAYNRTVVSFDKEQVTDDASAKLSEMFKMGDEIEVFVSRALCESRKLVTVPECSYFYVLNPTSTVKSRQTAAKQAQKYMAHRSMVDYLLSRSIELSQRHNTITVRYAELFGLCLWKIKENGLRRTLRLFDLIPVWWWHR